MSLKKPCPFCASTEVSLLFNGSHYYIQCFSCHATGPQIPSFEEHDLNAEQSAIQKWNNGGDQHIIHPK
jgi:hypothetical protein